jgi:hypothetical protein
VDAWENETDTRGGSRDTDVKEFAESPTILPSISAATTAMPVAKPAIACRIPEEDTGADGVAV